MPSSLVGQMISNIRLDSLLAEDPRVVVYHGQHTTLGIDVAVKILKPECYDSQAAFYYDFFRREAQIAAKLDDHPNIVRVLDFGQHDNLPYLVMEIIDGFSLPEYIRRHRGPLSESKTLKILMATATAMAAIYTTGICPCELKPSNLYITRTGQLKIAAIRPTGYARIPSSDGTMPEQVAESAKIILATDTLEMPLTTGSVALSVDRVTVGAVAYMAPEHFRPDAEIDQRSDLYTLGVIGYRAAFGCLPYEGDVLQIINGHLRGDVSFGKSTSCGAKTLGVIEKMMHPDPNARYDSVASMLRESRLVLRTLNRPTESGHGAQAASSQSVQVDSDQSIPVDSGHNAQTVPMPAPGQSALMDIAKSMERRFDDAAKTPSPVAATSTQFLRRLFTSRKTPQS